MSAGSQYSSTQFTIRVAQPLAMGGAYLQTIDVPAEGYTHAISAFGGFDWCEFFVVDSLSVIQDWFENGLGRDIRCYDANLNVMWEGFVNNVTIRQGGLEISSGPLTDICNRLLAVYSAIDTSGDEPVLGLRRRTPVAEAPASQQRYGIWPKVLSIAGATDDNALVLRDTHLAEYADPETNSNYGAGGDRVVLGVQCLGYFHALRYPYNRTTGGQVNASTKIVQVLEAEPNGWLSGDMSGIATNSVQVSQWENDDDLAGSLLKGLTAIGDEDNSRWLFGIYEERKALYERAPDDWTYETRLNDPNRAIYNRSGGEVPPWAVRPGRWVFFSDFLPGRVLAGTTLRDDPRMLFIESVTVRMPHGLEFTGGKIDHFRARLGQLGLAGLTI